MTKKMALVLAAALAAVACGEDEAPNPNPNSDPPGDQTSQETQGLSTAFKDVCAVCHGEEGRGKGQYPAIPGTRDESAFIAIVRAGRGDMPPTDESRISDADLEADYRWLTTKRQ